MNEIKIKANAKLNLFLDVLGKRNDGFHDVNFINCTLELHDIISIKKTSASIKITSIDKNMPKDENNLCFKVAQVLFEKYKIKQGIEINIEKNIPYIGGLGGGSSDAAATIKGLNQLFGLNLKLDEMIGTAKEISTDACFCLVGGTCEIKGIGELVIKLKKIPKLYIMIIEPNIKTPEKKTRWMYENLDKTKIVQEDIRKMKNSIELSDKSMIIKNIFNCFEQVDVPEYKTSKKIIEYLKKAGINSTLCGSGPSVFGISDNISKLNKIKNELEYPSIITRTI